MFDKFSDRHIGVTNPEDLKAMLAVIGVKSVDELIAQVIPQSIRLKQPLALPQGMSEYEFANHIQALAAKNRTLRSFIGMGYYPCAVPAAVARNVAFVPGAPFYAGDADPRTLRLSYVTASSAQIDTAIAALADAIRTQQAEG